MQPDLIRRDPRCQWIPRGDQPPSQIQTGRRRVIDFLWSPLVKVGSEGLRER